jgi:glucose/arabinose dehydrogenase
LYGYDIIKFQKEIDKTIRRKKKSMIKKFFIVLFILFLKGTNINAQFTLQDAFPNLSFSNPLFLTHAADNTNRIFIVEQAGKIKVFPNSQTAPIAKVYLDITDRVFSSGELGLLGLAFHPDYTNNGYIYVNYTANNPLRTIISRFQVTTNPDSADKNSEFQILTFNQPQTNHNGGWVGFGPNDGYLYIATGDGGGNGDPQNNGQSIYTMLGKILRIDVDSATPYAIPVSNPFYDSTGNVSREIYAWGFRNPWRCSFDPVTDQFWVSDVGQNLWEEIDIVQNGKNYGWRCYEGNHPYNTNGCNYPEYINPIWEYGHSPECSITGGYVYRGPNVPELEGKYIYGDYCSNKIWSLEYDGINPPTNTYLLTATGSLTSFGVDQQNELYLTSFNGKIYRFTPTIVPVELSSFSAVLLENRIKLIWRTETEVSNYGFEVEKSQGLNVKSQTEWETIGFVEGHGNSNSPKEYSFIDENVTTGRYSYRLKQIDTDGNFEYSEIIEVEFDSPINYKLSQNYPNPFNPTTAIRYNIPEESNVTIKVFNLLGKEIDTIANGVQHRGFYEKTWNAERFSSGVYYVKMIAQSLSSDKIYSNVIKMVYLK